MLISLLSTHYLFLAIGFFYAIQKNISFVNWLRGNAPFKTFLAIEIYFSAITGITYMFHPKIIIFLVFAYHIISVVFMLVARDMTERMFKTLAETADVEFAPIMSLFYLMLGILTLVTLFF